MKKSLLTMAAALALVSCSQDDLMQGIENRPTGAISAKVFVPTITRGTALDNEADLITAGNGFDLYAFLSDGTPFMGTETDGVAFVNQDATWDYANSAEMRFWSEAKGSAIKFYAVSPMNEKTTSLEDGSLTKSITSNSQTLDYTVPTTCNEQVDLMYAVTDEYSTDDETADHVKNGITLQFRHALSQIVFKAKTESDLVYADILSVTIKNLYGTGLFDMATAETYRTADDKATTTFPWDFADQVATAEFEAEITETKNINTDVDGNTTVTEGLYTEDVANAAIDLTKKSEALLLLPQNLEGNGAVLEISCKVRYKRSDNDIVNIFPTSGIDEYATISVPVTTSWQPGYKYIYTLIFSAEMGNPIKVQTVGVDEWNEQTEIEVPVEEQTKITLASDGTFKIYNAAQLADARDKINSNATYTTTTGGEQYYSNATYVLMNDIDLAAYENWESICPDINQPFTGTFVGNNKTISNVKIDLTQFDNSQLTLATSVSLARGLFGCTDGANIKNISVIGEYKATVMDYVSHDMGGFVGRAYDTIIENCHFSGSILISNGENYNMSHCCGGIAGLINNTKIVACTNSSDVVSEDISQNGISLGGIVGESYNNSIIAACYNAGEVSIAEARSVGGILGQSRHPSQSHIISCYNISTEISETGTDMQYHHKAIGTIFGGDIFNGSMCTLKNCYSVLVEGLNISGNDNSNITVENCKVVDETQFSWSGADPNNAMNLMNNALIDLAEEDGTSIYEWHYEPGSGDTPLVLKPGLADRITIEEGTGTEI